MQFGNENTDEASERDRSKFQKETEEAGTQNVGLISIIKHGP